MAERPGRPIVSRTKQHEQLTEFVGEWKVSSRLFMEPNSAPIHAEGVAHARVALNGLVSIMETELFNGYKSVIITTWNGTIGRYEGHFIDIHSLDGFDPIHGAPISLFGNLGQPESLEIQLPATGVAEERPSPSNRPTVVRTWTSRLTIPRMASLAPDAPAQLAGVDSIPVQITESKVSENHWLLLCSAPDANGNMFVNMENTFTR